MNELNSQFLKFIFFSFFISFIMFLSVYNIYWKSYVKTLKRKKFIKNKLTKNKVRYIYAFAFSFIFSFIFNLIFLIISWFILK